MRQSGVLAAVLLAALGLAAGTARADEPDSQAQTGDQPEASEPAPDQWMATVSGGVTRPDGRSAAPFGQLGLTRRVGPGYVRLAATGYRSPQTDLSPASPTTYMIGNLAAGGTFGGWIVELQGSLGRQSYDRITAGSSRGTTTTASHATTLFGFGGTIGRSLALDPRWTLTPSLGAGFVQSRLAFEGQSLNGGGRNAGGTVAVPAWSGSLHLRLDRKIAGPFERTVGAFVSGRWTSNAGASLQPWGMGGGPGGSMGPGGVVGAVGFAQGTTVSANTVADTWVEAGLAANLGLSRHLWLDAFATRSFAQVSGETTSVGLGLRRTF